MGGGIVHVGDRMAPRDPHAPLHVLPAPSLEALVEGLGFEQAAADHQVRREHVLLRLQSAQLGAGAIRAHGELAMQGMFANQRGLLQREAAESHGWIGGVDEMDPPGQEVWRVRQHVAVQEQQMSGAGLAGQTIAALGPPLVGGQSNGAGGKPAGLDRRNRQLGQSIFSRAIVEQHDLDRSGQGVGFQAQGAHQGAGVIVQVGDQHRQPRAGLRPGGIVHRPRLNGGVHAAAPCSERTSRVPCERTPEAFRARASAA